MPPILGCPSLLMQEASLGPGSAHQRQTRRGGGRDMVPRANSALRRAASGGLFGVGCQAEFFEHLRGVGTQLRGAPGDVAPAGVEHGTVGMLDQRERCHGFEQRDLYFLTFAASFPGKQRHRRRMNRYGFALAGFMVTPPARRPVFWSEANFSWRQNR